MSSCTDDFNRATPLGPAWKDGSDTFACDDAGQVIAKPAPFVSITASIGPNLNTDNGFTAYGQATPNGRPRAVMTAETVCMECGKPFMEGHVATAHLAIPPAQGTWRHTDCNDPSLAKVEE